jgi:hypothetical protein
MTYGIYENNEVVASFAAPMSVTSNQPVFVSDTLSLKRYIQKRSAQRWEIETNVEPLSDGAQELFVSLVTKGSSETVFVLMPQNYGVIKARKKGIGTPLGTAFMNSAVISIVGNQNGFIPKGTFIKFSNHSKIYMTTNNLAGSGSLNIFPQLRVDVLNSVMTWYDDVLGSFLYDTDTVKGMTYTDGVLMDIGRIKLVEKL